MAKRQKRNALVDVALGAAAGALATWLMDSVTTVLYDREGRAAQKKENAARGEKTAYEIAAEKSAALVHEKLNEEQRKALGSAIHWSLGIGSGALYGLMRNRADLGVGSGVVYGTAFWLGMDEAALTFLGLTPPPSAFPWQTHVRGLVGHLVLGTVIEGVFDLTDQIAS